MFTTSLIILQTLYSGQHNLNYNFITFTKQMTETFLKVSLLKTVLSQTQKKIFLAEQRRRSKVRETERHSMPCLSPVLTYIRLTCRVTETGNGSEMRFRPTESHLDWFCLMHKHDQPQVCVWSNLTLCVIVWGRALVFHEHIKCFLWHRKGGFLFQNVIVYIFTLQCDIFLHRENYAALT